MKATILAFFAAVAGTALAQEPFYNVSSKPFHLVVKSSNKTLDGVTLAACHEGAAIEALCTAGRKLRTADVFNFNTSSFQEPTNSKIGDPGILSWTLPTTGASYPSALTLQSNPTSNVAVPLFFPGDTNAQQIAFDKKGLLNIQGTADDSVSPIEYGVKAYYRWYICTTNVGYTYETLAWVS